MFWGASHQIFENAKQLRNNPTFAESLLWEYLRTKPLGHKFRRQHPIGIYIADFYCHSLKLIIEVDGSIHDSAEAKAKDESRENILATEGIKFLRFRNEDIAANSSNAIKMIENYIINKTNK